MRVSNQVSTSQHTGNMRNTRKKYTISLICVLLIGLILTACAFIIISTMQAKTKDQWDAMEAEQAEASSIGMFGHVEYLSGEKLKLIDQYHHLGKLKLYSLLIAPVIWLLGLSLLSLIFRSVPLRRSAKQRKYKYLR